MHLHICQYYIQRSKHQINVERKGEQRNLVGTFLFLIKRKNNSLKLFLQKHKAFHFYKKKKKKTERKKNSPATVCKCKYKLMWHIENASSVAKNILNMIYFLIFLINTMSYIFRPNGTFLLQRKKKKKKGNLPPSGMDYEKA